MFDILNNGVVRIVLLGTVLLGVTSGMLGVFTLLKKQALIGDALSHSTLPGVVLMFIITKSKNVGILLIGASIAAALSMLLMNIIKKYSKIKSDAVLALLLASFFGFGRFLISLIARNPIYSGANLNDFIFGSAATIIEGDIIMLSTVLIIILILIVSLWRHLKLQTFNNEFYESLGFSSILVEFILSFMTILVIVSGIRTVGVILMSSLLIVPGISARQYSNKLHINVILAALFGGLSAFFGTIYSVSFAGGIPTGPVIVIFGTSLALISLLIAPKKGIIAKEIRRISYKKSIMKYQLLIHLYDKKSKEVKDIINTDNLEKHLSDNLVLIKDDNVYLSTKGQNKVLSLIGGKIL